MKKSILLLFTFFQQYVYANLFQTDIHFSTLVPLELNFSISESKNILDETCYNIEKFLDKRQICGLTLEINHFFTTSNCTFTIQFESEIDFFNERKAISNYLIDAFADSEDPTVSKIKLYKWIESNQSNECQSLQVVGRIALLLLSVAGIILFSILFFIFSKKYPDNRPEMFLLYIALIGLCVIGLFRNFSTDMFYYTTRGLSKMSHLVVIAFAIPILGLIIIYYNGGKR